MIIYTVKAGDDLNSIGLAFDVSPLDIAEVNGLNIGEPLVIGMNLVIPDETPGDEVTYTVVQGDTLFSISQRFDVSVMDLISLNALTFPFIIHPGDILIIRPAGDVGPTPPIETFGYYIQAGDPNASLIRFLGQFLTYIGVFDFPVTDAGEITGVMNPNTLVAAQEVGSQIFPVLTNLVEGEFDSELGRIIVSNREVINNLLNNIIDLLKQYNLPGVMIDFENLFPEDRNLFTNFIRLLSDRLHSQNKLLGVNIAPKWEDLPDRPWAGFFDYAALAPYMDLAAIMTYEWGWKGGPPTPTAPLPFVRRVLEFAIASGITPDKIIMGMTNYGYDWLLPYDPESLATTVVLEEMWTAGRVFNVPIVFDDEVKQSSIEYTDFNGIERIAWFEDALSHNYKYQLALEFELRGVFYWTINFPLKATWYIVSNTFDIQKG
mgnify:CR=1 FL=1